MSIRSVLAIAVCFSICSCGGSSTSSMIPKLSPKEAQEKLDLLWANYLNIDARRPLPEEVQFRRVKMRKQIRAIHEQFPDWPMGGPKPGEDSPLRKKIAGDWPFVTPAEMHEILEKNEEYDKSKP